MNDEGREMRIYVIEVIWWARDVCDVFIVPVV